MANPSPADGGLTGAGADASASFPPNAVDDPTGICGTSKDAADWSGGVPPPPIVSPIIWIQTPIVLVKKSYTAKPTRQPVLLSTDQAFDGTGTFTVISGAGKIRFFSRDAGGSEINSGYVISGAALSLGTIVYAEGAKPSDSEKDVTLQLSLTPGCKPVNPPVTSKMTSLEVTLDICKSRKVRGVDPDLVPDKIKKGRTVHVQTGYHHGRAMVIIRKAKPETFSGKLSLSAINNKVRLFAMADEVAIAGQAVLADPFEVDNASITAPGVKLWAEGAGISNAIIDTGFKLGVKSVDPDGDRVAMTVVQFSQLKAVVFPTEANQVRMGNGPVPLHNPLQGGLVARDYDEAFAVNPPLVLVENSVIAAKKVALSVRIKPRVPVFWEIKRNLAPAPLGDHADIIKLSPNPIPTLTKLKADTLTNTLMADAVGSFHICPFVDCNDSQEFTPYDAKRNLIDREPFIVMNLVLIRAQGFKNKSKAGVLATQALGGAATITAATGLQISSPEGMIAGNPWTAAGAQAHNTAKITVIGGGGDGKLGLDQLFAGWIQNISNLDIVTSYLDTTVAPPVAHVESMIFAQNAPATLGNGVFHQAGLVPPGWATGSTAAPVVLTTPVLDVSPFGSEGTGGNTCVGTEGAVGPPSAIIKKDLPTAEHKLNVGQDWEIEQFDSPGMGASPAPLMHTGTLVGFHFNIDFRTDLCVWTNFTKVPGATPDPACRLYSAVQKNQWTTRYAVSFNVAGAATVTVNPKITVNADKVPKRIAAAVEAAAVGEPKLEVRFPVALKFYSIDART
jgi:hypothetical protein